MQNLKYFTVAAALLLSIGAIAQPTLPDKNAAQAIVAPQIIGPEQVIHEFADAISEPLNLEAAARLVEGGQTGEALKPVAIELQKERTGWIIKLQDAVVVTKADTASAQLILVLRHRLFGRITHQERLTLHRVANEWKIVPLSKEELYASRFTRFDSDILGNIAAYLARPQEIQGASDFACLTNLKQLGLAAFQFLQDEDERFAFKADKYQDALMPYIRSEQVFHCPDDKNGAPNYAFNVSLENLSFDKITQPAQTVMIYEGKNGELDFRHNNRAGVAFADGHCELVTPEKAKTLKWKP